MDLSNLLENKKIGFIGGGNMAQAIAFGLIKKGVLKPSNVWVSSRTESTLSKWKSDINRTFKNHEVVANSDIVFLAIKPQNLDEALKTCKSPTSQYRDKLFISILVGTPLSALSSKLCEIAIEPRIIRSMPNTPMEVAEGITVFCSHLATDTDESLVKVLFSELGCCEKISETLMNSAGGLTGSGPAYAFMIIEALADGAVKNGIPRNLATNFAAQVLIGAGKMVLESGKHPGLLKDMVCSPGGSTIRGVHEMERAGVRAAMINAIDAAVHRSDELASLLSFNK